MSTTANDLYYKFGMIVGICCTCLLGMNVITDDEIGVGASDTIPDDEGYQNFENTRIVGGSQASLVPFMVSIQRNGGHFCGGSLLSQITILSACHCVGDLKTSPGGNSSYTLVRPFSPKDFVLQAGDWVLYRNNDHSQRRNARSFHVHPKCVKINGVLEFDFSLVTVEEAFERTPFVRPTRMIFTDRPAYRERLNEILGNRKSTCWVMGWGKPAADPHRPITRFLKKAEMRIIPDSQCQDLLGKRNPIFNYYDFNGRAQVCARGVKSQDSDCTGDSGGPIWCRDHVMAIVSYGMPECGKGDVPAVYAKLEDFIDWYKQESIGIIQRGRSIKNSPCATLIWPALLTLTRAVPTILANYIQVRIL